MANTEWREEVHDRDRKEKLETYLFAMKEDLSEWLAGLMNISVTAETFVSVLDNGILLCKLASMIQRAAERYLKNNPKSKLTLPRFVATFKERGANYGSFVSRDNVANFIRWCRELGILDAIIFESEDLVLHKYQKPVILTLLDVARRAAKFDVEPPDLVKMEEEIDEEIALEQQAMLSVAVARAVGLDHHHHGDKYSNSQPVKAKTNHVNKPKTKNFIPKNLDTLVKETVQQCTCEDNPFPIEKIADGKYKIGENRVLIFVRVMRNHVMVRVGGGWDTLENYIQKHDPCRTGGRSSGNNNRRKSRCVTPNHHHNHQGNQQDSGLHSASTTSVASSDSSSSSSSLSRVSPGSSHGNSLQSMVCVFGESGARAEMVSNRDDHSPSSTPFKRFETPVKSDKKKNSVPARSAAGTTAKGLGTRYKSLTDLTAEHKGKERGRLVPKKRTATATPAKPLTSHAHTTAAATLRASLQEADLTFGRSKTSDAILSRTRRIAKDSESPHSVVKRRGNGNLSREASSESIRLGRARTTGARRKSVEGRKRSPEVRRRAAVSPAPARRRLEPEYDTTSNDVQKRNALRKDLNDNNLHFSRSVSADTIGRGNRSVKKNSDITQLQPSRIPVPTTTFGKPRGLKWTSGENQGYKGTLNEGHDNNVVHNGEHLDNRCSHCDGECCMCDEGFIDGELSRSSLRPNTLYGNNEKQREFKQKALSSRTDHNGTSSKIQNGEYGPTNAEDPSVVNDQAHNIHRKQIDSDAVRVNNNGDVSAKDGTACSKNTDTSLEWKEVMTDILKFEENRISDANF